MNAITAEGLCKQFPGGTVAVDGIDLGIAAGEVFGFLGPNGAGKTTTVKLLTGMLRPSGGGCRVFGADPGADPVTVHGFSGIVTEHAQMYDHLTGMENLCFYGRLFGLGAAESRARAGELLCRLELSDAGDRALGTYSTGMRQRLSLARAMLHRPKVLFLDEPTSGLDPESAQQVNAMIRRQAQEEGATVFLCTHQLRYAQEICTAYGLIDGGRMLASGTLEALRAEVSQGIRVRIRAEGLPPDWAARRDGDALVVPVESEDEIPRLVSRMVAAGGNIYHVCAEKPSLEDIYFTLIERREAQKEGPP